MVAKWKEGRSFGFVKFGGCGCEVILSFIFFGCVKYGLFVGIRE